MADHVRARLSRRTVLALSAAATVLAVVGFPAFAQAPGGAAPLKIGIIGSGHIGGTLGTLWAKAGHPVFFSSRHPEELKGLVDGIGPLAKAGTVQEAIAFGDVILLAVPFPAIAAIGKEYASALASKALVLDASNPIPRRDGEDFVKTINDEGGAALATAKMLPGSKVVRGFNAIGYGQLPEITQKPGEKIAMPIAGDDAKGISIAEGLVRDAGLQPVVIGGLAMGKYLVPGTPLAGQHSVEQIHQIVATLH